MRCLVRRSLFPVAVFVALTALLAPGVASAEADGGELGSFRIGPRVGGVLGVAGPRGGYAVALEIEHRTPWHFRYGLTAAFYHLLPTTIEVDAGETVPAHDLDVTGLYAIPITFRVGLAWQLGRVDLHADFGAGMSATIQTVESDSNEDKETVVSAAFSAGLGADILLGTRGLLRLDATYLWPVIDLYELTGGENDANVLLFTIGYSWRYPLD